MPYLALAVIIIAAAFYYRAAEFENAPPLLWAALSVLTSVVTLSVLGFGWLGCLLGQLALLAAITAYRILRATLARK